MTHEWKERGQKLEPSREAIEQATDHGFGWLTSRRYYTEDWRSCVRCGVSENMAKHMNWKECDTSGRAVK